MPNLSRLTAQNLRGVRKVACPVNFYLQRNKSGYRFSSVRTYELKIGVE
jgi:hypothetical protein